MSGGSGVGGGAGRYRIGVVTRLTGLSADVVRVWERRYGAITPTRTDGGTRLYTDADIARLRKLREAVEKGHGIGQAAKLSDLELDEIAGICREQAEGPDAYSTIRERFLEAVQQMDVVSAELELGRAASLFPPHQLATKIISPILDDIGRRWEDKPGGAYKRVASGLVRNLLSSLIRVHSASAHADTIVLATPAGEHRELGLLLVALVAASRGWRVVCLGADVPSADIVSAVRSCSARCLLLSVETHSPQIQEEIEMLARSLPGTTRVVMSSVEAPKYKAFVERAGWASACDLDMLNDWLAR